MIGQSVRIISLAVIALLLASADSLPAENKTDISADSLLRSIGMRKPAMTRAPDFTLRDTGGGTVSLSGQRGRLVLLNFWATWCGPCRDEMPSMEALSRNFGGQGFTILAVNQKETAARVIKFMKTHGLNFNVPLDTDGRVNSAYRVYGIPVSYLIDGNGNVIGMKSGPRDWASPDVVEVFRKLIADGGGAAAAGSMNLEPTTPLPGTLRAKSAGLSVHSQQDPFSEVVAKLSASEEVVPLGTVSGAGEIWYMIRTKTGAVGWVKGAEVEEINRK
jgi:peroxiredoxin